MNHLRFIGYAFDFFEHIIHIYWCRTVLKMKIKMEIEWNIKDRPKNQHLGLLVISFKQKNLGISTQVARIHHPAIGKLSIQNFIHQGLPCMFIKAFLNKPSMSTSIRKIVQKTKHNPTKSSIKIKFINEISKFEI